MGTTLPRGGDAVSDLSGGDEPSSTGRARGYGHLRLWPPSECGNRLPTALGSRPCLPPHRMASGSSPASAAPPSSSRRPLSCSACSSPAAGTHWSPPPWAPPGPQRCCWWWSPRCWALRHRSCCTSWPTGCPALSWAGAPLATSSTCGAGAPPSGRHASGPRGRTWLPPCQDRPPTCSSGASDRGCRTLSVCRFPPPSPYGP